MFRAIRVTGVHLAASLLVGIAAAPLAAQTPDSTRPASSGSAGAGVAMPPPAPAGTPAGPSATLLDGTSRPALPPLQGRPSQAHIALNRAIECQRRGDYESAAPLFLEAQRRQADLTPKEQHELAQLMQDNTQSLQARRDATDNLFLAEKALAEGRQEDASSKLRRVSLNEQYLAPADRQRFQALFQPLRRTSPGVPGSAGNSGNMLASLNRTEPASSPAQLARDKIKQARMQLGMYQFEAAEKLASEADAMNQSYNRGEDTPRDVLRDVGQARSDPKALLTAARAALGRKDYDRAEQFAQLASQLRSGWSLQLFGDTPAKVLKDIQTARARESAASRGRDSTEVDPKNKEAGTTPSAPATAQNQQTPQKDGSLLGWLNPFGNKSKPDPGANTGDPASSGAPGQQAGATGDLKPFNPGLAAGQPAQPRTLANLASTTPNPAPGTNLPSATVGPVTQAPPPGQANRLDLTNLPRARVSDVGAPPGAPLNTGQTLIGQTPPARQGTPPTPPLQPPTKIELTQAARPIMPPANNPPGAIPNTVPSGGGNPPQPPGPMVDPRLTQASTKPTPPAASTPPPPSGASLPLPAAPVDETEAARVLIARARQALQQGNFAQARTLNDQARQKKANLAYWEDNPNRVAVDLAESEALASVRQVSANGKPSDPPGSAGRQDLQAKRKEEAVTLLQNGRALEKEGKIDEAMQLAIKARSLNVRWGIFEETPDKLQQDLTKERKQRNEAESVKVLAEARRLFQAGELDAAMRAAYQAQRLHGTYSIWYVGDRPSLLLPEIEAAKQKKKLLADAGKANAGQGNALAGGPNGQGPGGLPQNPSAPADPQQQARLLLIDARQAMQKGDVAQARLLADHVKKMNIRFYPGEDTPEAVIRDLDLAQAPKPATTGQPGNPAVVQGPPPPASVGPVPPTPIPPVRTAQGPVVSATPPANQTPAGPGGSPGVKPVVPELPPSVLVRDQLAPAPGTAAVPPANPPGNSGTPGGMASGPGAFNGYSGLSQTAGPVRTPGMADGTIRADMGPIPSQSVMAQRRAQAQQLLVQARALQRAGKLIEARAQAIEAQKIGAPFGPQEDSPELALRQLDGQARQQTDYLMSTGYNVATAGKGPEAARYQYAEKCFLDARQLAAAFGQDTQPCDARLGWLGTLRTNQPGTAVAQNNSSPAAQPAPLSRGQMLLQDARRDLRAGDTPSARRKAQEAFPDPAVRDQAVALIRSIDAEENNQRALEARRGFDAALKAYRARDYAHARSILNYVDVQKLDDDRRERLRNIMCTPEMSPTADAALAQVAVKGAGPGMLAQAPLQSEGGPGRPDNRNPSPPGAAPVAPLPFNRPEGGFVRVDDLPKPGILEATQAMRAIKFQQLRQDSIRIQSEAAEKFRSGQTDQAMQMLQDHLALLGEPQLGLDPTQTKLLSRPVESRMEQYRVLKTQQDKLMSRNQARETGLTERGKVARAEEAKQKEIAKQMKLYNELYAGAKYEEAMTAAQRVRELDPDSSIATAAYNIAKNQLAITGAHKRSQDMADVNKALLDDAELPVSLNALKNGGIALTGDPKKWEVIRNRKNASITNIRKTEKEREIEHKLSTPVTLNFADTSLKQVIEDLRTWNSINIWVDDVALQQEGINLNQLVTIKLEQVTLRSALTLLLRSSRLTYLVKNEVLEITTENEARGKLVTSTYLVADLVIPITDFGRLGTSPLTSVGGSPMPTSTPTAVPSPIEPLMGMWSGTPVGSQAPLYNTYVNSNGYGNGGTGVPIGGGSPQSQTRIAPPTQTQQQMLIDLITRTIGYKTWSDMGGPGTIEYFPLTMSLVVNQTPDLQEQIQDLLQALRRLQDQEVAVEVKVVSISEDFFEQIGVSFSMNIPTNSAGLASQVAQGYIPSRLVSGITPAGNLTNDLSIPITNNIFANQSLPFFGGGSGVPGFGGISAGIAFLSDIQVFLFMQAAQGDSRTNVMQAPKLTLFNGQTATLTVSESAPFVSNVTATVQNGLVLFTPTVTPLVTGVTLTLQAVISRGIGVVRLSLNPTFNVPVPGPVALFPIVVPVFPVSPIGPGNLNPIVFTQYIHLPVFNSITVVATVAVPDGGTVVLGGLKLLSEARQELGPPILSKIPYISRLFRNVAYGKDTASLMIMVTPRIIIMEEEETYQTGFQQQAAVNQ